MVPAKKSEPAAAVEPARRRSTSRARAATDKVKMPAASAETTVKRAVATKAAAPVAKAKGRKAGKS
jgi:hypothetical protein